MKRRLATHGIVILGLLLVAATARAAEPPTIWRMAVVLYGALAADCEGPVTATTTPAMRALALAETAELVERLETWTAGAVVIEVTIIERPVLASLTDVGPDCWPDVGNVTPYPLGFDSTIVLWPPAPVDPTLGASVAGRGWAAVLDNGTHGTALIPDGSAWFDQDLSLVMAYEWLHGALAWFEARWPARVPDMHDYPRYGYPTEDPTWYADLLTGCLPGGHGVAAGMWAAAGTPTAPGDGVLAPEPTDSAPAGGGLAADGEDPLVVPPAALPDTALVAP